METERTFSTLISSKLGFRSLRNSPISEKERIWSLAFTLKILLESLRKYMKLSQSKSIS